MIVYRVVYLVMSRISNPNHDYFYLHRHYRLEAEIASMTWKVNWCDVITKMGDSKGKRGSRLSLARQSVIVSFSRTHSRTPVHV